jgi:hypothetical protein
MKTKVWALGLGLLLSGGIGVTTVDAMDTKAAGKCVVFGALHPPSRDKAEAILATASRTGQRALVDQRAQEEIQFLAANKADKKATETWALQAARACQQF